MAISGPGVRIPSTQGSEPSSTPTSQSSSHETVGRFCLACSQTSWDGNEDPEDDVNQPLHGWPELAKKIAENPDFEAFPLFKDLNIKSLLYYQAELDELRTELHETEWKDHRRGQFKDAEKLGERVDYLLKTKDSEDVEERHQMKLMARIRAVLKEYNDALLQYSQVSALPKADRLNVSTLRVCLRSLKGGKIHIQGPGSKCWGILTGKEQKKLSLGRQFLYLLRSIVWKKKTEKDGLDLIVPRSGHEVDGLTTWVASEFVPFWQSVRDTYHKLRKPVSGEGSVGDAGDQNISSMRSNSKPICGILPWTEPRHQQKEKAAKDPPKTDHAPESWPTLNSYSEDRMLRFTSGVATVIACLLPTVAIAILSKMQRMPEILGFIALFTTIFAIGLMLLTDAGTSRVEIFTATAAFSAVMVVFVQNQYGGTNQPLGTTVNLNGTYG